MSELYEVVNAKKASECRGRCGYGKEIEREKESAADSTELLVENTLELIDVLLLGVGVVDHRSCVTIETSQETKWRTLDNRLGKELIADQNITHATIHTPTFQSPWQTRRGKDHEPGCPRDLRAQEPNG